MSDFELSFELKQHTPIIHFQSEQHGATLRATELKPKFDKFLIKYAFDDDVSKYKKFLVSEDKTALNYKVNIFVSDSKKGNIDLQKLENGKPKFKKNDENKPDMQPFPCFFATMGKDWEENKKYFVFNSKIKVIFKSFNKDLLDKIKEFFPKFLMITNFGTRQSKGFGAFTAEKCNGVDIIDNHTFIKDSKMKYWSFDVDISKYSDIKVCNSYQDYQEYYKLFDCIETFYKTLRSGINLKDKDSNTIFYLKSLLFNYLESIKKTNSDIENIEWDKKAIKSKFLDGKNNPNVALIRDLLGLSTIHEYRNHKFTVRHPKKGDKYYKITEKNIQNPNFSLEQKDKLKLLLDNNKNYLKNEFIDELNKIFNSNDVYKHIKDFSFEFKDSENLNSLFKLNEVERYKSSITFKPIKKSKEKDIYTVYIIVEQPNKKFLNKEFLILKEENRSITDYLTIKTPKEFDLISYIYYVVQNKNEIRYIDDQEEENKLLSEKKVNNNKRLKNQQQEKIVKILTNSYSELKEV